MNLVLSDRDSGWGEVQELGRGGRGGLRRQRAMTLLVRLRQGPSHGYETVLVAD